MQPTIKVLNVHPHLLPERLELSRHLCLPLNETWRNSGHLSPRDAYSACFLLSHNQKPHCASSASSLTILEHENLIFLAQSHLSYLFQCSGVVPHLNCSLSLSQGRTRVAATLKWLCHSCASWRRSLGLQSLKKWPTASCTVCSTSLVYTVGSLMAHQSWHASPHIVL